MDARPSPRAGRVAGECLRKPKGRRPASSIPRVCPFTLFGWEGSPTKIHKTEQKAEKHGYPFF